MEMWKHMCMKDTHVDGQKMIALEREVKNLRRSFSTKDYNFNGCVKMETYCPFTPIEDLMIRKVVCIGSVCGQNSNWRNFPEKWSPLGASIYRLRRHITIEFVE